MPVAPRRSSVRRSNVTACARCKARKQRCDQNLPACANCERAGVDCVGHDLDGSVVPRSYLKSLEDRVAHLEQELQQYRQQTPTLPTHSDLGSLEHVLAQASFVSLHPSTFPSPRYMGTACGLPLLRLLLLNLGSASRFGHVASQDPAPSSIMDLLPHEVAVQLPAEDVSHRLIDVYFEHCDFFSPILYRADVLRMLATATDDDQVKERYKLFMVLAIAIQLLNRTDASIPAARADAYFSAASRILLANPADLLAGDLQHLENLLLLIQYSSFSSTPSGTWHIIGLTTRLAVDLGLHDEPPAHLSLDPLSLDRRKRLFWATYTFERNLCAILGRPVSIPDEAIFVSLPANVDDEYITEDGILQQSGPSRKALALQLVSDDIVFLAECAQKSIEAYRYSFRDGKLRFYWRTVHNLFRSGVSLIYCLKNWPGDQGSVNTETMNASVNSCSAVLWGMVERYPAGKPCRDTFESLCQSLRDPGADQSSCPQSQTYSCLASDDFLLQNFNTYDLFSWTG
ncbi:Fungal specific transcription factor domain containing protein [Lasiodiplodia theobromae]|uniref:Fungal specific transcription factor domain containing protein n=1 Tax=Lasiodiplodia theobromae TaxID=45133 RepID=UPI0015C32BF5|nr:Fungal specific transcription factor domain containing protein [Lasiodiplodia theobromae]KAF4536194.1 Fungal specific transcription factor domain containing protein [Lasiodiplodia theobromae]